MIYTDIIRRKQQEKIKTIRAAAIERAHKVASLLKEKYSAKRIILFGSLVRKTYLHERSDIDLLVEGIVKEDILHAGYDASIVARPFDVDIIPLEIADKKIVEIAGKEGVEL